MDNQNNALPETSRLNLVVDSSVKNAIDTLSSDKNINPTAQLKLFLYEGLKAEGFVVKGGKVVRVAA